MYMVLIGRGTPPIVYGSLNPAEQRFYEKQNSCKTAQGRDVLQTGHIMTNLQTLPCVIAETRELQAKSKGLNVFLSQSS